MTRPLPPRKPRGYNVSSLQAAFGCANNPCRLQAYGNKLEPLDRHGPACHCAPHTAMQPTSLRRYHRDLAELKASGWEFSTTPSPHSKCHSIITVVAAGPTDTAYAGYKLVINMEIPNDFPFGNPSVGFAPRSVWHPNVDWASGSICVDALREHWKGAFRLHNIPSHLLPSLLLDPNPKSPLNAEAAREFEVTRASPAMWDEIVASHMSNTPRWTEEDTAAMKARVRDARGAKAPKPSSAPTKASTETSQGSKAGSKRQPGTSTAPRKRRKPTVSDE